VEIWSTLPHLTPGSLGPPEYTANWHLDRFSRFWATISKLVRPMLSDRYPVCLSCAVCDGVLWPNGWTDQDETWHAGRPRPWPHCVRWDAAPPPPKEGGAPKFSANVYCGQTAVWIKMVLGMEVGLSPGDFVLDGDPAPSPPKEGRAHSPIFGPFLLWPNVWMHQHDTWYGGTPRPRRHCVR